MSQDMDTSNKPRPARKAATKKAKAATTEKRKPGRPPFQPTDDMRELVKECAGAGCSHDTIVGVLAAELGVKISDETLRKYFGDELANGAASMDARLQHAMCALALEGNYAALVFLHATRKGISIKMPKEDPPPPPPPPPPVVFTINSQAPQGSLDHLLSANTTGKAHTMAGQAGSA
ncbi:hypothetical protein [Aquabacterium olei]|uniref:hypothetical protein n=1 Tax=Aquabacterium olei TaxID=1296669 RepID=UPI00131F3B91|nr:hypothetical protein [Aquabacterium olei]